MILMICSLRLGRRHTLFTNDTENAWFVLEIDFVVLKLSVALEVFWNNVKISNKQMLLKNSIMLQIQFSYFYFISNIEIACYT